MKRLVVAACGVLLAGCGALPPAAPTSLAPTASPVVVVQTVLVTVIPSEGPTEFPTPTLAPSFTPEPPLATATSIASPTASPPAGTVPAGEATAPLPPNPGGDLFTNMTRSGDRFSLRCQPDAITFGVTTSNPYVTGVDIYYRIQDRLSVSISNWQWAGSLQSDKHGNFTLLFPATRVDQDLRSHRAWFDYQFVGVNKSGDAVGRSAKISKQITYTIDCSD